jgi:hypothetical protein
MPAGSIVFDRAWRLRMARQPPRTGNEEERKGRRRSVGARHPVIVPRRVTRRIVARPHNDMRTMNHTVHAPRRGIGRLRKCGHGKQSRSSERSNANFQHISFPCELAPAVLLAKRAGQFKRMQQRNIKMVRRYVLPLQAGHGASGKFAAKWSSRRRVRVRAGLHRTV